MNGFGDVLRGLDWTVPIQILLSVIPALICITLHECAHGYAAYMLGDDTARRAGRLTLNPIKHIDIIGLIMLAVFHFGWAKPVPVNMRSFKDPKQGMALTAAAGPLANLLIAVVMLFIYGLVLIPLSGSTIGYYVAQTIGTTAYLSLTLALFNIIPIPPLDGSKVLYAFLPEHSYRKLMYYERYGMIVLMLGVLLLSRTNLDPLGRAAYWLMGKLFTAADWGFALAKLFV